MSRSFLTYEEHERLTNYPTDMSSEDIGRFFTLTSADIELINHQRRDYNRLGFALQLCTIRYLGFIPDNLLTPPDVILRLLAYQLETSPQVLEQYGHRDQTRSDHLNQILNYLNYARLPLSELAPIEEWLVNRAMEHDKPTFLIQLMAERLRWDRLLRPGITILEKSVTTARKRANQITYDLCMPIIEAKTSIFLDQILERSGELGRTHLKWLQQLPNDHTASQIKATLNKIGFLLDEGVKDWDLQAINPNRLKFLANIGARATNQQLQRMAPVRRYPILIAFLKQSLLNLTDITIDMFDACLWEKHTDAKNELDEMRLKAARSTNEKLRTFSHVAKIVMDDAVSDADVRATIFKQYHSDRLQAVVSETEEMIRPDHDEAIDLFAKRYGYIRQFSPKLLSTLVLRAHREGDPLIKAVELIRTLTQTKKRAVPQTAPTDFLTEAWRPYVFEKDNNINRRYYELATLWELRKALRSGDIFVTHARRHTDTNTYLIPVDEWSEWRAEVLRLTSTPSDAESRLTEREGQLERLAQRVEALLSNAESDLTIKDGSWVLTPFSEEDRPTSAIELENEISERLPRIDITDLLIETDQWTKMSDSFTHVSSGHKNQNNQELKYLYASLISQGCNHSLAQMSRSSNLPYHRLVYASTWFLREDTLKPANNIFVNYHHGLDVSRLWGSGVLSSSDGQRFPMTGKNRKARSILKYFGYGRGVTFYTWASDQFSMYGSKAIASTVRDATYVLDEILANETELPILEHTTDTNGYTEIVFALFDLLGLTFTPRIKDLASQQLYRTNLLNLEECPQLRDRLSKRSNTHLIIEMWDEILRFVGSLKLGWVTASLAIQKLQSSARKSKLARALQEYGRLIKTIHILGWYESEEKRRWANRQLNKGEAIHALKAHLIIGNRGVLRRKTDEDLQHQVGCLNVLTNSIILWNSVYMGKVLEELKAEGRPVNPQDLKHIWPTRFEHINVYGKYEFNVDLARNQSGLRNLRNPEDFNP
ncbi:MAG: Tn3 family transposase [Anaerolineae bacterium]